MAQKVVISLTDDLDPNQEATGTYRFGLGPADYEIDLTDEHAEEFRAVFAPFVEHGRRVIPGKGKAGTKMTAKSTRHAANADIRNWARSHGLKVSDRGRIGAEVIRQYEAAHN